MRTFFHFSQTLFIHFHTFIQIIMGKNKRAANTQDLPESLSEQQSKKSRAVDDASDDAGTQQTRDPTATESIKEDATVISSSTKRKKRQRIEKKPDGTTVLTVGRGHYVTTIVVTPQIHIRVYMRQDDIQSVRALKESRKRTFINGADEIDIRSLVGKEGAYVKNNPMICVGLFKLPSGIDVDFMNPDYDKYGRLIRAVSTTPCGELTMRADEYFTTRFTLMFDARKLRNISVADMERCETFENFLSVYKVTSEEFLNATNVSFAPVLNHTQKVFNSLPASVFGKKKPGSFAELVFDALIEAESSKIQHVNDISKHKITIMSPSVKFKQNLTDDELKSLIAGGEYSADSMEVQAQFDNFTGKYTARDNVEPIQVLNFYESDKKWKIMGMLNTKIAPGTLAVKICSLKPPAYNEKQYINPNMLVDPLFIILAPDQQKIVEDALYEAKQDDEYVDDDEDEANPRIMSIPSSTTQLAICAADNN